MKVLLQMRNNASVTEIRIQLDGPDLLDSFVSIDRDFPLRVGSIPSMDAVPPLPRVVSIDGAALLCVRSVLCHDGIVLLFVQGVPSRHWISPLFIRHLLEP